MKKYIGTKHIEAEPMTMGEAYEKNLLQAGRVPNESERITKAIMSSMRMAMRVGHQLNHSRRHIKLPTLHLTE